MSISIHAPLAGRDLLSSSISFADSIFQSTRPLRGATGISTPSSVSTSFQSTRPLRGATFAFGPSLRRPWNFNPRAPCGARPQTSAASWRLLVISIHAPLAGRDFRYRNKKSPLQISIHAPLAGRDVLPNCDLLSLRISIHAPLAGRDDHGKRLTAQVANFNPRAPCGARLFV